MRLIFYIALMAVFRTGVESLPFMNDEGNRPMPVDVSYISLEFIPSVRRPVFEVLFPNKKEEIQAMVQVVSNRFHKISMYIGDPSNNVDSLPVESEGPFQAARMNKEANYTRLHISTTFVLSPQNVNQQSMDYILDVVSTANEIYPGTVSRVIVYMDTIDSYDPTVVEDEFTLNYFLQSLRKRLNGESVKLGLRLWLRDCDPNFAIDTTQYYDAPVYIPEIISLPSTTSQLLLQADFVLFFGETFYNFPDLEETFDTLTNQFSKCEQAVLDELNNKVTPHLQFSWSSRIGSQYEQDMPYNLVKFWKLLGDWAANREQDVFINGAFDTPISSLERNDSADSTEGWWRLVDAETTRINMSSFVEKFSEIENWDLPPPPQRAATEQGFSVRPVNTVGVIFLLWAVVAGAAFGVGARFTNKANAKRMFSFSKI